MRTIAIINQKGGCGKTTCSINLAAALAQEGQRTLLVDMDPQSHCALGLAVPESQIKYSSAELMRAGLDGSLAVDDVVWQIARFFDLIPSSMALAAIEAQLQHAPDKDRRLAQVLSTCQDKYDFCIIDCPPSIGLLTFNALRAATEVIVPVETGYFSMEGAKKQHRTIEMLARRAGHNVQFSILPTMYDVRTKLAREILAEIKRHFTGHLLPQVINFNAKLKEAASFGQPITEYDATSRGMQDFEELAQHLVANPPARAQTVDTLQEQYAHEAPNPALSRAAELVERARALSQRTAELSQRLATPAPASAPASGRAPALVHGNLPASGSAPAVLSGGSSSSSGTGPFGTRAGASNGALANAAPSTTANGFAPNPQIPGTIPAAPAAASAHSPAGSEMAASNGSSGGPSGGSGGSGGSRGSGGSGGLGGLGGLGGVMSPDYLFGTGSGNGAPSKPSTPTPAEPPAASRGAARLSGIMAAVGIKQTPAPASGSAPASAPTPGSDRESGFGRDPGTPGTSAAPASPADPESTETNRQNASDPDAIAPPGEPQTPAPPDYETGFYAPAAHQQPSVQPSAARPPASTLVPESKLRAQIPENLDPRIADLYGVRKTSQGLLFVQPVNGATSMAIAGDFNGWNPQQTRLKINEQHNVWQTVVPVPPGRYRYRLVVDGKWVKDPYNTNVESNPFGELNNVVVVK